MQRIKLSKVQGGNGISTDTVTGTPKEWPPKIKERFTMFDETKPSRYISTSPVQTIAVVPDGYVIETLNSVYKLKELNANK